MLMKLVALALLPAATLAADATSAMECQNDYVQKSFGATWLTQDRCEALITFSKCLSAFPESKMMESKLMKDNAKDCEPFWRTDSSPEMKVRENDFQLTVDDAKDIKFFRHRREELSIFDMNEQIVGLQKLVSDLTTQLESVNSNVVNNVQNKLDAMKQDQDDAKKNMDDAMDNLKDGVASQVNDVKTLVTDSVSKLTSDTAAALNKANTDTAAALDKSKNDAATANAALEKKISGSVTDKLKPFEGTEVALTSLKRTYHSNPKIPVYRVARFFTHHPQFSWFNNNDNQDYGGIHPSTWTDGRGRADRMNADVKYLQRVFTQKETSNKYGANICSEMFEQHSSTNGMVCMALFRIKNTGTSTIRWAPPVTMTSWHGWGETASVTLNGNNLADRDCYYECRFTPSLDIPANSQKDRISTAIFQSTSSHAYGHHDQWRASILLFRDNSLNLPNGLEFVDDLDTMTGSWKK